MSLGGRIAQRGKAVISVSGSALTPREPLLFLYPPWIRTAVTAVNVADRDGGRNPEKHTHTLDQSTNAPDKARSSYGHSSLLQSSLDNSNPSAGTSASKPGVSNTSLKERRIARETKNTAIVYPGKQYPSNPVQEGGGTDIVRRITAADKKSHVRRVVTGTAKSNVRVASKQKIVDHYQEQKRLERQAEVPDWRLVLQDLVLHTPERSATWHENALRVKVPIAAVGQLLFGEDDNIWKIKERCGADIELTDAWDLGQDHSRALVLSGPITAVAKASAEIMMISKAIAENPETLLDTAKTSAQFSTRSSSPAVGIHTEESFPALWTRNVRHIQRHKLAQPLRADDVPRPSSWTTSSLGLYVQWLVSMNVSSHQARFLYEKHETHHDVVMKILRTIFLDDATRMALSTSAFNEAMAYFVKHNRMTDVRELYVHMRIRNLRMDTETYNIMLRGAAKTTDLYTFRFILKLMLKDGLSPNGKTWVAFVMVVSGFEIKGEVLKCMKSKELLGDFSIKKEVVREMALHEINTSLDQHQSQKQFLDHMDLRYGQDWLSDSCGNRIINAMAARGLISRCWDFMLVMHDRGIKLDHVTVNTVLDHCERHGNASGAVEIIRRMSSIHSFAPNERTYEVLFTIAGRRRLHNVARVVWQYACLDAKTSSRLRRQVRRIIESGLKLSEHAQHDKQQEVDPQLTGIPKMESGDVNVNPVSMSPIILPGENTTCKVSAGAVIRRDLDLCIEWEAAASFVDVLKKAYDADQGVDSESSKPEVNVPVQRRRDRPKLGRSASNR